MNKNFVISLGIIAAMSLTTISAFADSTIYTDGIGRMHFLGKDAASNKSERYNYSNSAEQDLTRKLYENADENGMINDTSYEQHPLKNYENTFPDSRFTTTKYWKTKYDNGAENAQLDTKSNFKGSMTFDKQYTDASVLTNTTQDSNSGEKNAVKTSAKKHWWNRNK